MKSLNPYISHHLKTANYKNTFLRWTDKKLGGNLSKATNTVSSGWNQLRDASAEATGLAKIPARAFDWTIDAAVHGLGHVAKGTERALEGLGGDQIGVDTRGNIQRASARPGEVAMGLGQVALGAASVLPMTTAAGVAARGARFGTSALGRAGTAVGIPGAQRVANRVPAGAILGTAKGGLKGVNQWTSPVGLFRAGSKVIRPALSAMEAAYSPGYALARARDWAAGASPSTLSRMTGWLTNNFAPGRWIANLGTRTVGTGGARVSMPNTSFFTRMKQLRANPRAIPGAAAEGVSKTLASSALGPGSWYALAGRSAEQQAMDPSITGPQALGTAAVRELPYWMINNPVAISALAGAEVLHGGLVPPAMAQPDAYHPQALNFLMNMYGMTRDQALAALQAGHFG